ncbi:MAG: DUF2231 domain-containing protein [Terriglobales bacterium]
MSGIQSAPIRVPESNQNTTANGDKDRKRRDLTTRISTWIIGSNLIGKIAPNLDGFLHRCFAPPAMRQVKLFLNGTWAGHPLHPALTDVPIGAWTIVIALDLTALLFHLPQLGLASSIAVLVGVAGALGAVAAGLADWIDVDPPEKAIGAFHAIVNVTATVLFFCSFLVRWKPALAAWLDSIFCLSRRISAGNGRRLFGRRDGLSYGSHDQSQCLPQWPHELHAGCDTGSPC